MQIGSDSSYAVQYNFRRLLLAPSVDGTARYGLVSVAGRHRRSEHQPSVSLPVKRTAVAEAADSGGQEGQPPLLAMSRRGKTIYLPLHLTHSAGWLSYK